jgi:hypothetical protein
MPHLTLSNGHLALHSSGHLRLQHPGYTFSAAATTRYKGSASEDFVTDPYDPDPQYSEWPGVVAAAIASMTSGSTTSRPNFTVYDGVFYEVHHVVAAAKSFGYVYTITANSGAPFGSPLADIEVTIGNGYYGSSIAPLIKVGTSDTLPTGNPIDWSGTSCLTSQTLEDFAFKKYLWTVIPSSYSASSPSPYEEYISASISATNIRYVSS